jgi:hypothetical protein
MLNCARKFETPDFKEEAEDLLDAVRQVKSRLPHLMGIE